MGKKMRAKIIADIAVVVGFLGVWVWWLVNVPFPRKVPFSRVGIEPTPEQSIAIVLSVVAMVSTIEFLIYKIIQWIHKG